MKDADRTHPGRVRRRRRLLPVLLLASSALLPSCKISDDATALAKQMATTSADLTEYYSALSGVVKSDIALGGLQNSLLPHGSILPFPDSNRALLEKTSMELDKRAALAKALQQLANSMGMLTGSSATADVSAAATKLGSDLGSLKPIAAINGAAAAAPTVGGDVGNLLAQLIQEHDEKAAAPALAGALDALRTLFAKETPAYDSLEEMYLHDAAGFAKFCVDKDLAAVNVPELLAPVLQPFDLPANPSPQGYSAQLKGMAKAQIDASTKEQATAHRKASAAMLKAMIEMSTRAHQLMTEGIMPARDNPLTLTTVEQWLDLAKSNSASAAKN